MTTSRRCGFGKSRAIRQQEKGGGNHRGREWDIFGMVEHRAIPGPAERQHQCSDEAGAWTGDRPCGRPGGRNAADAGECAQQMAQFIKVERDDLGDKRGDDVEQAAIEVEIVEVEQREVSHAAGVVGDDQFAVVLLHAFIIADAIVAKGQHDDGEEQSHQTRRRHAIRVVCPQARTRYRQNLLHILVPADRMRSSCGQCSIGARQPFGRGPAPRPDTFISL